MRGAMNVSGRQAIALAQAIEVEEFLSAANLFPMPAAQTCIGHLELERDCALDAVAADAALITDDDAVRCGASRKVTHFHDFLRREIEDDHRKCMQRS